MKKILAIFLSLFLLLGGLAGCTIKGEDFMYDKIDSDSLAYISYSDSEGTSYRVTAGNVNFTDVQAGLSVMLKGITLEKQGKGTLEIYGCVTLGADEIITIKYLGNIVERDGKLYQADRDLTGIIEIFQNNIVNTENEFYNVAYGIRSRQKLDIFLPEDRTGNVRFVLLLHGGGWQAGSKEDYYHMCETLNSWGYGAVTMNYRFAPNAKIPDMLEDIKMALQYIKDNADYYDLRADKAGIMGGSAGAHLALLYGYKVNDSPIDIAFIVSQSGPADFTNPEYPEMENSIVWLIEDATGDTYDYQGPAPATWIDASPVTHVSLDDPYTIICNGTLDTLVPYSEATALAAALGAACVPYDLVPFVNGGHGLDTDIEAYARMYTLIEAAADNYLS